MTTFHQKMSSFTAVSVVKIRLFVVLCNIPSFNNLHLPLKIVVATNDKNAPFFLGRGLSIHENVADAIRHRCNKYVMFNGNN